MKTDPEEAKKKYERAYDILCNQSETHPNTLKAQFNLAFALSGDLLTDLDNSEGLSLDEDICDRDRAESLFTECYENYKNQPMGRTLSFFHPDTSNVRTTMVKFYSSKGQWDEAMDLLDEIIEAINERVLNCQKEVENTGNKDEQEFFELDMRLSMYDVHMCKGDVALKSGDLSLSIPHLCIPLITANRCLCWTTDDLLLRFPPCIVDFMFDDDHCTTKSKEVPYEPILPDENDEDKETECSENVQPLFADGALETKLSLLADSQNQLQYEKQENVVESWVGGFIEREPVYWKEHKEEAGMKRAELEARKQLMSEWSLCLSEEQDQANLMLSRMQDIDDQLSTIQNFNEQMDEVGASMVMPLSYNISYRYPLSIKSRSRSSTTIK